MAPVAGIGVAVLAHGGTAGLAAEILAVLVGIAVMAGALYILGRRKIDEYAVDQPGVDEDDEIEPAPRDED
jgi:hypothetical protein